MHWLCKECTAVFNSSGQLPSRPQVKGIFFFLCEPFSISSMRCCHFDDFTIDLKLGIEWSTWKKPKDKHWNSSKRLRAPPPVCLPLIRDDDETDICVREEAYWCQVKIYWDCAGNLYRSHLTHRYTNSLNFAFRLLHKTVSSDCINCVDLSLSPLLTR